MYGKGLLKGLKITIKHLFEKDLTIQYPETMPYLQKRFRGSLAMDFGKCIACGSCTKTCPNNVLSIETAKDEVTKKKKLLTYVIDLQYCMFCNQCVEVCPVNCLYFTHDFELSQYNRDDIKIVYHRPPEMDLQTESGGEKSAAADEEAKKEKKVKALITAMQKNPAKMALKFVENEEQANILTDIVQKDEKKLTKLCELMVEDKEKASKVAMAFVKKELKQRQSEQEGGGTE